MHTETRDASQPLYCTKPTVETNSAGHIPGISRNLGDLHGRPIDEFAGIRPHAVTSQQARVLADLALTVLQRRSPETAATVAILCGRMNDLDAEDFRESMVTLVKRASGSSLDVIAGLCRLRREITVQAHGQFIETDTSFSQRLLGELDRPAPPIDAEQLIGISIRSVLHFSPQATVAQQETAIEKAVKAVKDEIVRTQVDGRLRINDLWKILRLTCQGLVLDVGEPNRPFLELFLWRQGRPEPLIGNYIVQPGERLIVEPSLPAAIDIRPAGV